MRLLPLLLLLAALTVPAFAADLPEVTVYKDPHCGCCTKWIEHLEANGFAVKTENVRHLEPIKRDHRVPPELASCHTAIVGGYVVEGHVPADTIKRLLRERPPVVGVSVPGMPMGSPGMESPHGADHYEVVTFDQDGKAEVYESH